MTAALAPTPPMGWNSWNQFGPDVNEQAVREMAEAMVTLGFKNLGYRYVVIDDCWSLKQRDKNGNLVADPAKFPGGMKALADHVHGLGLKFGIYSDAAEQTCGGYLGSFGFEEQDAALWASWGVDFLKYDYCHAPTDQATAIDRYGRMGKALQKTGRPILYSLCEWGGRDPHVWSRQVGGHQRRVTGDLFDSWVDVWVSNAPTPWYGRGVDQAFDVAAALAPYGGPDAWNDLDMLVVGLKGKGQSALHGGGLSAAEYRTHMSLWVLACSPLMIGCDLRKMDAESRALLSNPEVLAVNQDALAVPGRRVWRQGPLEAWTKPLADGNLALLLANRGSGGADLSVTAGSLGLLEGPKALRDLWMQKDVEGFNQVLTRRVQPHESLLFKITGR
jgi:alpha-galactosidase